MTSFAGRRDFNTGRPSEQPLQPIHFLYRGRDRWPSAVALEAPGARLTYAELVANVEALATAFQEIDPSPGSRVGTCAWNTAEHVLSLLATYAAGKVWVPLNPRNGNAEIAGMLEMTRPGIVVVDESCRDKVPAGSWTTVGGKGGTGVPGGQGGRRGPGGQSVASLVERFRGRTPGFELRSPADVQIIKFSGGSTGKPKAVLQSVRCLNAQASAILATFDFQPSEVNLVAAPVTHGTSCFILPVLAAGGRHVLLEKATPAAVLEAFMAHAVTSVYLPPTLIYMMLTDPALRPGGYPALRHLIYSAAPMPPERIRQVRAAFGPVLETAYGQVEAPQIITAMRAHEFGIERNLESVGRAAGAEVAILDRQGHTLPAGEIGEVVVRGDLVMNGYLDQPELTAQTIVKGWLHTGDLGLLDDRGYLYLKGRLREVINSGGFSIFPSDVESALAQHPAVAECSVFGMDDPKWGEAVHAAVRLRERATATEAELIGFVKGRLDSVKAPKRVHFLATLPHNAVGKVSRRDVKDLVMQEIGS